MQVFIRNKVFSIGGSSSVVDQDNRPVYKVKGKIFTFTAKKRIYDMQGNKLFTVRNRFFNPIVHKAYIYDAEGNKIATVKDKVLNFHKEYFVEGLQDDISTEGDFFSLTTHIYRNDEDIGTIRRQITFIGDAFVLDADEADIPFMVALVIAIDNIQDRQLNQSR